MFWIQDVHMFIDFRILYKGDCCFLLVMDNSVGLICGIIFFYSSDGLSFMSLYTSVLGVNLSRLKTVFMHSFCICSICRKIFWVQLLQILIKYLIWPGFGLWFPNIWSRWLLLAFAHGSVDLGESDDPPDYVQEFLCVEGKLVFG